MGKLTAKLFRSKSKKKVPLAEISANETLCGTTRSKKQKVSISNAWEEKENTPVRSSRQSIHNEEEWTEASRSLNENQQYLTQQKLSRSTDPSQPSGLRRDGEASRGEDSVAGSQSNAPVDAGKEEDFLPDDNEAVKDVQVSGTAESCSPSEDGEQSGAPVEEAVERQPECPECFDEQRPVGCTSRQENMVSDELAGVPDSKPPPDVQMIQSSEEESEERLSSGRKKAPSKTYRRISSRKCTNFSVPNAREQSPRRDLDGMKWAEFCKSDELQETVAGATEALQDGYNKLYKKYQNLKTRRLAEAAEAFDKQSERIRVFATASDNLVQNLRTSNTVWAHQEEMINRSRAMEAAYIECQNDLVVERARNLELTQHLENAELRGSKLLHDLLANTTELTISNYGKSEIMFSHYQTGYEFKLEQNELSEEVGGKNALLYNVVSPGTILHFAPEWMQTEIVFDMTQAKVFFLRLAVTLHLGTSG
ncbi:unnamed protein product [Calypogeia fissa]